MLVLSRKKDQSVRFPNLGISVEILQVNGKTVRVGIDAPRDISVMRGELQPSTQQQIAANLERQERHALCNRLHAATLALHVLQKQLDAGRVNDAEKTLNRALNSLAELDQMAAEPVAVRKSLKNQKACRALVVEDNANERQLLAGFLELCGYQVDVVEDGEAALDYLATHTHPDIVLLDVNMPRLDGPSTVTAIRSNPEYSHIKLFMVSGEDQTTVQVPVGEHGISQWFSKPLQPTEFANELEFEVMRSCSVR